MWGKPAGASAVAPLRCDRAGVAGSAPEHLTARLSQALLLFCGVDHATAGQQLILPGGAVWITAACSGIDPIAQLLVIAVAFLLAFPLPARGSRWWMLALAPLVALLCNAVRIGLLALITASQWTNKTW